MQIIRDLQNSPIKRPMAVALGNFDGVHRGHQQLIKQCVKESRERGWSSCVLTFEPHPAMVLAKHKQFKLLNSYEQKYRLIAGLGVDYLCLLSFDSALAVMPPEAFVHRCLIEGFELQKVFIGFNFTFGDRGLGTSATLEELGKQNGFAVSVLEPVVIDKEVVSSSLIREKYQNGNIAEAARLLGYWPVLEGEVVPGEQRGRQMGFPTANLQLPDYILLPSYGVYAAFAEVRDRQYPAIINVGIKPTFGGEKATVEAYLLDRQEDLYGQTLRIKLVDKIRPERKFRGLDDLKEQITADVQEARQILEKAQDTFTNNFPAGK